MFNNESSRHGEAFLISKITRLVAVTDREVASRLNLVAKRDWGHARDDLEGVLLGDPAKVRSRLGWRHRRGFRNLIVAMVEDALRLFAQQTGQVPSAAARRNA